MGDSTLPRAVSRVRALLVLRAGVVAKVLLFPRAAFPFPSPPVGLSLAESRGRALLMLRAGVIGEVAALPSAVFPPSAACDWLSLCAESRDRTLRMMRPGVVAPAPSAELPPPPLPCECTAPGSETADLSVPLSANDRSLRVAGELGSGDCAETSAIGDDGSRREVRVRGEEVVPIGLRSKLSRFSSPVRVPVRRWCCGGVIASPIVRASGMLLEGGRAVILFAACSVPVGAVADLLLRMREVRVFVGLVLPVVAVLEVLTTCTPVLLL